MLASGPNGGHAYAEVYLGNMSKDPKKIDQITCWLKKKYHLKEIATHYNITNGNIWLNLDWGTNGKIPYGSPGGPFFEADKQIPIFLRVDSPKTDVGGWPTIILTYQPSGGELEPNESIIFDASQCESVDSITTFYWDFGDNTTTEGSVVTHAYANDGNFTVSLQITDKDGKQNITSVRLSVRDETEQGKQMPDRPEIKSFTVDRDIINPGESSSLRWTTLNSAIVTLDHGIGRVPPNGSISISPGNTTTYVLKASNSGYEVEGTIRVLVNDYLPSEPPKASISRDNLDPVEEEWITFDGSKSSDKSGNIIYYEWNFGDGSIVEGKSAQHAFYHSGTYVVTLTVFDDKGLKGYTSITVSIRPMRVPIQPNGPEMNNQNPSVSEANNPSLNAKPYMHEIKGCVKYIGGNVVRIGVDVMLQEKFNGNLFDIGSAVSSRGDGTFKLAYSSNRLHNPDKPCLIIQAFYHGEPFTDPVENIGDLNNRVELICSPH
jgi:PKD repeat protein